MVSALNSLFVWVHDIQNFENMDVSRLRINNVVFRFWTGLGAMP